MSFLNYCCIVASLYTALSNYNDFFICIFSNPAVVPIFDFILSIKFSKKCIFPSISLKCSQEAKEKRC